MRCPRHSGRGGGRWGAAGAIFKLGKKREFISTPARQPKAPLSGRSEGRVDNGACVGQAQGGEGLPAAAGPLRRPGLQHTAPCWGAGVPVSPAHPGEGARGLGSPAFPGPVPRLPAFPRLPWEPGLRAAPSLRGGGAQALPGGQDPHPEEGGEGSQRCHPSPHLRALSGRPPAHPRPRASPHGQSSAPRCRRPRSAQGPREAGRPAPANVTIKAPVAAPAGAGRGGKGGPAAGSGPSGNPKESDSGLSRSGGSMIPFARSPLGKVRLQGCAWGGEPRGAQGL